MTSSNVANYIIPIGMVSREWKYMDGKIYKLNSLKPKKNKKRLDDYGNIGIMYIDINGNLKQESFTEPVGNGLWRIPSLKKVGIWRTIRGKRYFFPNDGSGPIPKMKKDNKK